MKFLERLRTAKGDEAGQTEPRLTGMSEPHFNATASDAFHRVLLAGSAVLCPELEPDEDDPVGRLENAVTAASLLSNAELRGRMRAYRDAIIEAARHGLAEAAVDEAREHFILGCRLALGTNG